MSTVIAFNHIRSNSSLILRCKTIIRKELYICTYISANITTAIRTYENFRGRFFRKKAMSPKFLFIYLFLFFVIFVITIILRVIFTYDYTPPKPHFWTRVPIACQIHEHGKCRKFTYLFRTLRTQDTLDLPNFGPRTLWHVRSVPPLRHWCRSVFWTLRHYTCGVA